MTSWFLNLSLCALLTLPGGSTCFIDTPRGPYVLYWHQKGALCVFPLHVFNRYEIHIQDFEEVFTGIFIILRSSSSQKLINKEIPESLKKREKRYIDFQECSKLLTPIFTKHNIGQGCSYIFLYCLKHFGILKWMTTGFYEFENLQIMEFGDFGL